MRAVLAGMVLAGALFGACGSKSDDACTATASVDDDSPTQNSSVQVTGVLSCDGKSPSGAKMATKWSYKSTTSECEGVADDAGSASCSMRIGSAAKDFTVKIAVTFDLDGKKYKADTEFTPE